MKIEKHVGGLVMVRVGTILTSEDFRSAAAELTALADKIGAPVVVTDGRRVVSLPPSVVLSLQKGMRVFNELFARTAILFDSSHHQVTIELERIVREQGNPNRRIFTDPAELKEWVSGLLTDEERRALDEFLAD